MKKPKVKLKLCKNLKVQKQISDISKLIRTTCDKFLSRRISLNLLQQIHTGIINSLMSSISTHDIEHYLKFNVVESSILGQVNIVPENLYSFLILQGIIVPYWLIKDKCSYKTDKGTFYYDVNNGATFLPIQHGHISIEMKLND